MRMLCEEENISASAGNHFPIPGRTAFSLVTMPTKLSWLLFCFIRNVCKFSHVQTVRFPEDCTIIYRLTKAKNFSRQLIKFELPGWGPHRSTTMAHLSEIAQCLESHPRNLLPLKKLPAVSYQEVFLCWTDTLSLTANQTSNTSYSTSYSSFSSFNIIHLFVKLFECTYIK